MAKDWQRLREVLQKIHNEPAKWNQGLWSARTTDCGTSMCFAGWTTQMAGAQPHFELDYRRSSRCEKPDGTVVSISGYAQELLELSSSEADWLFGGGNSEDDIARIIQNWAYADHELLEEAYTEHAARSLLVGGR